MATVNRFPPSSAPIKPIKAVQMSVWDPDEIVSGTGTLLDRPPARLRMHEDE